jgi:hypothetical protein
MTRHENKKNNKTQKLAVFGVSKVAGKTWQRLPELTDCIEKGREH